MKILMGCFEVPGYGGASTTNYERFGKLQSLGLNVSWVNLIPADRAKFLLDTFGTTCGNPQGFDDVHNCFLSHPPFGPQPELLELIRKLSPDGLLGCHFIAAKLFVQEGSGRPVGFLTSGFRWMKDVIPHSFDCATEVLKHLRTKGTKGLPSIERAQDEAFTRSEFVVAHAPVIRELYTHFYPDSVHKITAPTLWDSRQKLLRGKSHRAKPISFKDRDIDFLFIANDWNRPVKNFSLVKSICNRFQNRVCALVGTLEGDDLKEHCPEALLFGLLRTTHEVNEVMSRAKVVISASNWDAAPGVLYEAVGFGCNIVCSKNCGNWELCHKELLVEEFHVDDFVTRMSLARQREYAANTEQFMNDDAQELLEQLEQFR